jgi:hypothetical protein
MNYKSAYDLSSLDDLIRAAHDDPKFIVESGFWVTNKQKEVVPFIFNEPQNLWYEERTARDDIVKAGQLGLSTGIEAILTVKFLLVENSWSVVISHEEEATKRLFEKVDFFLHHLPDWLKRFYRPETDSQKNMVNGFAHSKFYIGTAGARAFGRGDTIHYAHLSESSRWKDDGRIATGIIRAVPANDPKTWIVKETTANGEGTPHHIEYKKAKEGKSVFKAHFIPFFSNPAYRIPGAEIPVSEQTEDERILLQRFPIEKAVQNKGYINQENLAWRRNMIKSLPIEAGRSSEDMFKQEFPVDDTEAFLSSGNPVFPTAPIQRYKAKAREPIWVGNLEGAGANHTMSEVEGGWLKLWDMPPVDGKYVMFADVGQFSDYCVCTIVDQKTWKVIGKFRAVIRANAFGDELNKIGHFFNIALIAVEINNMGQSTADRLKDLKYPRLYLRDRLDGKKKQVTKEVGFHTTTRTKALIIGNMQELVGLEEIDIPDIEILDEMSTFVKTDEGRMEASPGNHDDCVISIAGCYFVLKLNPFVEKKGMRDSLTSRVRKYHQMRRPKGVGFRR